jgi:hypothetical protein
MRHIVATLGLHHPIFTRRKRPMGHGKIEALNRLIRSAFLAELKSSPRIRTLDALNEAFVAWSDVEYNRRPHGETGERPLDRWRKALERIRFADDNKLRDAFLWREDRRPDKSGVFSLLGERYQTTLGRRRIEVRFDPEALAEIEVWLEGKFVERVRSFLGRFGPFEPAAVAAALDGMFAHGARADQHPSVLLETLLVRLRGGQP